jgi:aspartate aminotransferase
VLLAAPYWPTYADQARMCGAEAVAIDVGTTPGLGLTASMLAEAITPRASVLILNSPCNPSGAVIDPDEIARIMDLACEHDLWVISDEIYEKLLYDGAEHLSPASLGPEARERVLTVNGLSKTYAMTGWRIGYGAGPREVIAAAGAIQSNLSSAPNSIAQRAAVEALTGPQDAVREMREEFDRRRRVLVEGLGAIPGVSCATPRGAFYAFPDCRALLGRSYGGRRVETSLELCEALLADVHLAAVPGAAFGTEGFVRLSYATSMETIEEGLRRLAQFVGTASE